MPTSDFLKGLLHPSRLRSRNASPHRDATIQGQTTNVLASAWTAPASSVAGSNPKPISAGLNSSTSTTAPNPTPTSVPTRTLWEQACDLLNPEEQVFVKQHVGISVSTHTDLQTVLKAVQIKKRECEEKRWRFEIGGHEFVLSNVADGLYEWLNKFKEIGDVAAGLDPIHAGLPWAGIKFLIQVAISKKEQMAALLIGLERIMYLIDRCCIYEILYIQRPSPSDSGGFKVLNNLTSALVELYHVFLQFLSKASTILDQSTTARALKAFSNTDIADLLKSCQSGEARLTEEANVCEGYYSKRSRSEHSALLLNLLSSMEQQSMKLDNIKSAVDSLWTWTTKTEQSDILTWISKIPFEGDHNSAKRGRTENTGEWFLDHDNFKSWTMSDDSAILWLHGIPGAGKTKLVSRVIDHLMKDPNDHGLAYFYCNRNVDSRRQSQNILQSFVRQLSLRNEQGVYSLQAQVIQFYGEKNARGLLSEGPTSEKCKELLPQLFEPFAHTTLILDALDECSEDSRDEILDFFKSIVETSKVKVLVSSRRNKNIKVWMEKHAKETLGISAADNGGDIGKFVTAAIEKKQPYRDFPLSAELQAEIKKVLLEKSGGMFQWAALQIHHILGLDLEINIRERLGKLPPGLKATYDEIFTEIENQDEGKPEIALRAIKWVMCSRRPLSPSELVAAACQNPASDGPDTVHIYIAFVLGACQNLLECSDVVGFAHLSVQEYFEDRWKHHEADELVATVCLSLLNDPDCWKNFEKVGDREYDDEDGDADQTLTTTSAMLLLPYARSSWPIHVQQCNESLELRLSSLLVKFLGSIQDTSPAYKNWHTSQEDVFGGHHWYRILEPCNQPLLAICLFGLRNIFSAWWELGSFDLNQRNEHGRSLIDLAIYGDHYELVKSLLEKGAKINGISALHTASGYGYLNIVKLLITRGVPINGIEAGRNALIQACSSQFDNHEVVKFLVSKGASVNVTGWFSTALFKVASKGYIATVELLLSSGAKVDLAGDGSQTPMMIASSCGHLDIVELLLRNGANVNAMINGETALDHATMRENLPMVELLRKNGGRMSRPIETLLREKAENEAQLEASIQAIRQEQNPAKLVRFSSNPRSR